MAKTDPYVSETDKDVDCSIDPRLSFVLVVLGIAAVFAAVSWWQLLLLAVCAVFLLLQRDVIALFLQRLIWLRWFFLFVLMLHMLLSPGYTLFGLAWLSYDGLLRGLQVSLQVSIALAASLVMTRLASVRQLASAAAALCRPLSLVGVNVDRFAGQVLMALHFVPILQEETRTVSAEVPEVSTRIGRLQHMVVTLMARLVKRADDMAIEAASNDACPPQLETLPPFWPLALADWTAVVLAALIAIIYGGLS